MRIQHFSALALGTLLTLGSCQALGGMDTSLDGIVAAASKLSGSLTTLLDSVGAGQMLEGAGLDSLAGMVQTGKGLLANLNGLSTETGSNLSLDGLKNALGGLGSFDLASLQGATTAEGQSGLLTQLKSVAGQLGAEASTLQQALPQ